MNENIKPIDEIAYLQDNYIPYLPKDVTCTIRQEKLSIVEGAGEIKSIDGLVTLYFNSFECDQIEALFLFNIFLSQFYGDNHLVSNELFQNLAEGTTSINFIRNNIAYYINFIRFISTKELLNELNTAKFIYEKYYNKYLSYRISSKILFKDYCLARFLISLDQSDKKKESNEYYHELEKRIDNLTNQFNNIQELLTSIYNYIKNRKDKDKENE